MRTALSFILVSALLLVGAQVRAQTTGTTETVEAHSGEVRSLSVTRRDCLRLVRARARDDVAFKPGVDVRGNPVKPADPGNRVELLPPSSEGDMVINFGIDLAKKYGFDDDGAISANVHMGEIKFNVERGELTFNGKSLQPEDLRAVEQACRTAYK